MDNSDTVELLKECDSGVKMAVASIDEVLERVKDTKMKRVLEESLSGHQKLENEIDHMLYEQGEDEKEPPVMAKGMSWMKTNVKLTMDASDATVADLITDGCHMGIKTLHKMQNQYKAAEEGAMNSCDRLIDLEEHLCEELSHYL